MPIQGTHKVRSYHIYSFLVETPDAPDPVGSKVLNYKSEMKE